MQISLAPEQLEVAMAVDEARQDVLAARVDNLAAGGDRDLAAFAHRLEPVALDDDDQILDRRPAGPVDQSAARNHDAGLRLRATNEEHGSAQRCRKRPFNHDILHAHSSELFVRAT